MTRRTGFLAAIMVVASLGAVAQSGSTANSGQQTNTDNSARHTVTISGCLSSSAQGIYTLAANGTDYTLAGNTDTLQGHTGQQIEITGQQTFASNTASNSSASAHNAAPAIRVVTARSVADHCSPRGSQQLSNGPSASSGDTSATHNGVRTPSSQAAVQNVSMNEASAASNGQLPQTSTILPLLGLIGLGSLVAGFFARR